MIKFLFKSILVLTLIAVVFAITANIIVISKTSNKVYHSIHEIPSKEVALVLGTSKRTLKGESNSFFQHRMEAAAALYKNNKVKKLLLSGSSTQYYNEAKDMKEALVKLGVPESVIMVDMEGDRTYASIDRCVNVFNQRDIMIITQEFHAFRALYISDSYDIEAVAYCAEEVPVYSSTKVNIREFFARPKALIDIYSPL